MTNIFLKKNLQIRHPSSAKILYGENKASQINIIKSIRIIIKKTADRISRGTKNTILFIPCSKKAKSKTNAVYTTAAGLANISARSFRKDKDSIFDS